MKKLTMILASAAMMAATPALAASAAGTGVYLGSIHIEGGTVYIFPQTGQTFVNGENCAGAGAVGLAPSLTNRDYYLSVAMTALASGKKVNLWVNGCTGAPWSSSPTVQSVYAIAILAN